MPAKREPVASAKRRAPGEARQELLEAARELFEIQGYAGTSTKQIAERAGVVEPLIFRYFSSKSGLFDEAMLAPYRDFIAEFMDRWETELRQGERIDEVTERFVTGLYDLMRDNRQLFLALIAARAFENDGVGGAADHESELSRQLDRFNESLRGTSKTLPPKYLDTAIAFRLIVGAVMAATVLDEWLFPQTDRHPSVERIQQELRLFTLYGVFGRRPR